MRDLVSRECSERKIWASRLCMCRELVPLSETVVCEKSWGLPGVVAETCVLVATALRHALHSPEAPCLMRLLGADLPRPRLTDCPRRGERSHPSMATRRHAVGLLVL